MRRRCPCSHRSAVPHDDRTVHFSSCARRTVFFPAGQSSSPQALILFSSMPTRIISPAVVASWITERSVGGSERLRLLVLWRGTPGWFLRPGGSNVSGGQSAGRYHQTITQGGLTFTLEYDSSKQVAIVDGKTLHVGDRNVIFVDDVDSPTGPHIKGTMSIESRMPGSAGQIGLVLRHSSEIMSFLRCDAGAPDGRGRAYLERLCLQNIGVAR